MTGSGRPSFPFDRDTLIATDTGARLGRLRATFAEAGIDALLVTDLVAVRYLTGFTGSAATLLVTPDEAHFATDGRYGRQAQAQLHQAGVDARIEVTPDAARVIAGAAEGGGRLGLQAEHVTWAELRRFEGLFAGVELVATTELVEGLRRVKDAGEVDRIAAAAAIADEALRLVRPRLLERPTEAEVALELDTTVRRLGADGSAFETIVAAGPNGARPHARPGSRRVEGGDLVVIDFGAAVDGYRSDMTRTLTVGEVGATEARMLEVVLAAQAAGVAAVGPGVACRDVDRAARAVIAEAGWAEAFLHGTGHGVGLDIHEAPRVGETSEAVLSVGEVVTVEPGVYLPDHGGVRIEDTVVVTADGCRVLTTTPKTPTAA